MGLKIIGLDESGTIGDKYIVFCQVEYNLESENELFINNILNIDNFLFTNEITHNEKTNTIIKLCHQLYKTNLIKVIFYKLSPDKQNSILKDAFKYQADFLFANRSKLLNMYERNRIYKNDMNKIIRELHHYQYYDKFPDYCLKSYSFLYMVNQFCLEYNNCEFLKKPENKISIQIDGGNVFSFWWYDFLLSHSKKEILQNKLFINGIAHGDECYLSINLADLFAKGYNLNKAKFYDYEVFDIEYDFRKLSATKEAFFTKIWRLLSKNVFKIRVLLIGKSEFFNLVVFLLHKEDLSEYYEPFTISGDIEYFFRQHSKGYPGQNIAIYGQNLSDDDKNNIKICQEMNIETKSITDFKKQFITFFKSIETSIDEYTDTVKDKIKKYLDQKKVLLS